MTEIWTVGRLLSWTAEFFKERGLLSPRLDAELLLAHALGVSRLDLYLQHDRPLSEAERSRMRSLVGRRGRSEPVQYILGRQEFWSLDLEVTPGVLIPRADTEVLVEEALAAARRIANGRDRAQLRIADVGTGSGAIALALAKELSGAEVFAGDLSATALALAARNATRLGLAERVRVLEADGLGGLWGASGGLPFDLVVSNPPYIPHGEIPGLMPEVREWEPREALDGGSDGLDLVRRLVGDSTRALASDGALAVEIGSEAQARATEELMRGAGFGQVDRRKDYAGLHRAVVARARLGYGGGR